MAEPDLKRTITFLELLHAFQRVDRVVHVPQSDRWENDVEHSYLLAMTAWYLIDSLKLPLDSAKAMRYALVHDLVEAYAGDTYIYTKDAQAKATKHERERKAQERIGKEFPEFPALHESIKAYERRGDEEGAFIYALDKLIPVLTIYLQEGRTWKEMEVTFEEAARNKREKIGDEPHIRPLLEAVIELIERERSRYFNA